MKSSKVILALWLGASAWAQTLPQKQPVTPPVQATPHAPRTSAPAASSAMPPAPAIATRAATPTGSPQYSKGQRMNDPSKQLATPAKPAAAQRSKPLPTAATSFSRGGRKHAKRPSSQTAERRHAWRKKVARLPSSAMNTAAVNGKPAPNLRHGRRDPFVSPVVERVHSAATCTGSGRQCLAVGELSLHGVVRSPSGFIAVVMNGEHTYFLREHDPLADGAVERITKDTIILRERSSDSLGRPLTHEVTKKLGVPAV